MQRLIFTGLVLSAAIGFVGCGQGAAPVASSPSGAGVAIIDLDEVASRLGQDVKMAEEIKARENMLNKQLMALEKSLQQQVDVKQKELGENATDEQKQQLLQMAQQANMQMKNAQMKVSKDLAQHRSDVINRFRASTKPHAEKAARAKGMGIVVTRNENVIFTHLPGVEITDDVVAQMSAATPSGQAPSAQPASQPAATQAAVPGGPEQR